MENTHLQHTNRQYEEELRNLRTSLLQMGGLVERQIANAVDSLVELDQSERIFTNPRHERTEAYITGRFG